MSQNDREHVLPLFNEISEVVKKFDVDVNILAGNIEALSTTEIGHLFVDFGSNNQSIQQAINYLEGKGILVEKI